MVSSPQPTEKYSPTSQVDLNGTALTKNIYFFNCFFAALIYVKNAQILTADNGIMFFFQSIYIEFAYFEKKNHHKIFSETQILQG